MRAWKQVTVCLIIVAVILGGCSDPKDQAKSVKLDPKNPVVVTLWNYYTGAQQATFQNFVDEFNQTVGVEKGIIVESVSLGSINDIANGVRDAVDKKVGASEVPNIFAAYADTVYELDQQGVIADLQEYFSQNELEEYVPGYIEEGKFKDEELKIFPISKSTEIFMMNKTDWNQFAAATGANVEDLKTVEGITSIAEQYYHWTDGLTETPDDGQAFFGRDAMANFFIISSMQLGKELFEVQNGQMVLNYDEEIMHKIWDNYYVPYIKGYFSSNGRFRSDDVRTGKVISFVGATSGATFFPDEVVVTDNESYPIEAYVMEPPVFKDGQSYAVQQGAGMAVVDGTEEEIYASVVFLKWITDEQRSMELSIRSGYLPVKLADNTQEALKKQLETSQVDPKVQNVLSVAIDTVNHNHLYTNKPFRNGYAARNVLENSLADLASADRKTVVKNINAGMRWEDAVAQFDTEAHFKEWYQTSKAEIEALL